MASEERPESACSLCRIRTEVGFGWWRPLTPRGRPARTTIAHWPSDLYTRDIAESLELAARAGAHCRPLVEYSVGPLGIKEAETVGPDGLTLVFLEVDPRRPSLLDRVPDRLHSEVHSIVWTVGDAGAALPTWTAEAGLSVLVDAPIGGPTISDLLGLPRPKRAGALRPALRRGSEPGPFELLQFTEDPGEPLPTFPLAAGLHAPAFHGSGSRRRHARHALGGLRRGRHGRHRGPPPSQRRLRRRPGWGAVRAMAGLELKPPA